MGGEFFNGYADCLGPRGASRGASPQKITSEDVLQWCSSSQKGRYREPCRASIDYYGPVFHWLKEQLCREDLRSLQRELEQVVPYSVESYYIGVVSSIVWTNCFSIIAFLGGDLVIPGPSWPPDAESCLEKTEATQLF